MLSDKATAQAEPKETLYRMADRTGSVRSIAADQER
jgi:hypothetical protein